LTLTTATPEITTNQDSLGIGSALYEGAIAYFRGATNNTRAAEWRHIHLLYL